MRGWRTMPLVLLLLTGCNRGDSPDEEAPADSILVETAGMTAELLSPVRATSIAAVEFAQLGVQRAENPGVREYATTVAADHRNLVSILDSIGREQQTPLVETQTAQELANSVRLAHSGLDQLSGGDFDMAFVRAEVESHRQLLDRIDQELLPGATNPGTVTLLRDVRAMADAHLARSRQLLAALLGEPEPVAEPPRPRPVTPAPQPVVPPQTPVTTSALPPPPVIPPITTSG